jgi:cytochrome c oxidase assembly protein subunit 15
MDMSTPLWNLDPIAQVALAGALVAALPLAWVMLRPRPGGLPQRWRALAALTLFLTFDLVVFGAFTRLTDSGLGCPDWPGCYGSASPLGARDEIQAAQTAMPTGPVTHKKAWIEMVHRYLASGVGVLIIGLFIMALRAARRDATLRPMVAWSAAALVWVIVQGLFGALTVTMKLYPAIVTLHLLGGLLLLAMLAVQVHLSALRPLRLGSGLRAGAIATLAVLAVQIALGGWVSTNYAVLACTDFPTCHGSWWPQMDWAQGFRLLRPLGADGEGGWLTHDALTAIHMAHRLGAVVTLLALLALGATLLRRARMDPTLRAWGIGLWLGAVWQLASGLSNVVLGWPLLAALAHTAGAAGLVVLLTALVARSSPAAWRLAADHPERPAPEAARAGPATPPPRLQPTPLP